MLDYRWHGSEENLFATLVLHTWQGVLPPILYVQLDNTAKENKNVIVFGYLSMLVEKGLFKKIKLNFLPVGHTLVLKEMSEM